jgi:SAM-dependent methyltransferase
MLWLSHQLACSPALRNQRGVRFLELKYPLVHWLKEALKRDPELGHDICAQFDNVLRHCDDITFDERGAAEAYVILHFLDRYHRFQMTFDELSRQGLMPRKPKSSVLDIGTGPGPSMFAMSDFFTDGRWRWSWKSSLLSAANERISIDYVERSEGFRHWLHHFTEFANYFAVSGNDWKVPYHHGSYFDFDQISFDRKRTIFWGHDEDGDELVETYIEKTRPDVIIMSNFLTTALQVNLFSRQIQDCARHLKHGGIFLIVGAKGSSKKYGQVYGAIDDIVIGGSYSRAAFSARCDRVKLDERILSYDYSDPWGSVLRTFHSDVRCLLRATLGDHMPQRVDEDLRKWSSQDYAHRVSWELNVYRKTAIPRRWKARRRKRKLAAAHFAKS